MFLACIFSLKFEQHVYCSSFGGSYMLLVKSAIASTSLYPYIVPPCTELLI